MTPTTLLDMARRLDGLHEREGKAEHPFIQWCHSTCRLGFDQPDETPWCSSLVNGLALLLGLPRSGSAAARSWLLVGTPIELKDAKPGNDVVILKRGTGRQPGPEVTSGAPGHVGLFSYLSHDGQRVQLVGGNQGNEINASWYPVASVLGVRRLA